MGTFEDRLAAGMRDPQFAEGYAEAKAELATLSTTAAPANGTTKVDVRADEPALDVNVS
jgi:hypothetical protein